MEGNLLDKGVSHGCYGRGVTRKLYVEKLPHVIAECFDEWKVATVGIKQSSRESVQATQQQPTHHQLSHVSLTSWRRGV
jgi:hypothetical protein